MKLQIVNVPARASLHWLQLGLRTFCRQPLALGLIFLLSIAIQPVVTLVLMVAADQLSTGRQPTRALLLSAWRSFLHSRWGLLGLCALYFIGCLLIVGLTTWIGGIRFGSSVVPGSPHDSSLDLFWTAWAAALLIALLALLFWHTPGLIHWHGLSPLQALLLSAGALLRNWRAFSLFLLIWTLIFSASLVLMMLLVTWVLKLTGPMAGTLSLLTIVATNCVNSALYVIFLLGIFFSFRDCFSAAAPARQTPLTTSPRQQGRENP